MSCRPLEWRLPCQMNCRKVWDRALTAVCGSSESFRQIIARADVPWSDVWRGSRRSMDTNQCHRASEYALEAPRMAIAMPDELQESVGPGTNRALRALCSRSASFRQTIARADVPWSAVWRGSRCSMDTNRCHRASEYALEARGMAIAVPDELQEREGPGTNRALTAVCGRSASFLQNIARADVPWSAVWRGSRCSMDTNRCHRASRYGLEAPRKAIGVQDELQERGMQGLHGRVWPVDDLPANHRASGCALERCLEGFAVLDGHKSMPSRELICPVGP